MGSVRDLPAKAADIPAALKKEKWARLGVDVEEDFRPIYIVPSTKKKVIDMLKAALKDADELIIATDEDREGESIGWHLLEILKPKVPVRRMVFHEITEEAIADALGHTRQIDDKLVRAQETRRILDRLYGYTLSPLLWKKIAVGLSAGRVQSVAIRLLVMRERERRLFRSARYWDLKALVATAADAEFEATMISLAGKRLATGKDFDPNTGKLSGGRDVLLLGEDQARELEKNLLGEKWMVGDVEEREESRSPAPPFTTSTLQQEANRKLGLTARQTMQTAQKLYERGFITYMRTDSVNLSEQAVKGVRDAVAGKYGKEYLSESVRRYQTKSKGAQEAHEAIRPAGSAMHTAAEANLEGVEGALYDMIWKRTMATQMAEARLRSVSATINAGDAAFRASGRRIVFPGFFRAYVEGSDDPEATLEDRETILPPLKKGDELDCRRLEPLPHDTKPPARFTEASLVQSLEREGIGRPSTYATIISTVQDRGYVRKQGNQLVPTFTAMAVVALLENYFPRLVDLGFTAGMEQKLDDIASGDAEWLPYLESFYKGTEGIEMQVKAKEEQINPREACTIDFDDIDADVRVGRFGAYIEQEVDGERLRVSLPENLGPADLSPEELEKIIRQKQSGAEALGIHPTTGLPIYVRVGPYGAYVQMGEESATPAPEPEPLPEPEPDNGTDERVKGKKKGAKARKPAAPKKVKPIRTTLPKGITPENLTLEQAIKLVEMPRLLGEHPESGKEIRVGIGRFGPYVMHGGEFASLKSTDDVLNVELPRALELFELKKLGAGKRGLVRIIGPHPVDGEPVEAYSGRFGPYVKHGGINAPVPKEKSVDEISVEEAVALLEERKANPVEKKPARRKK
jgi:DNA topoisomerase-1